MFPVTATAAKRTGDRLMRAPWVPWGQPRHLRISVGSAESSNKPMGSGGCKFTRSAISPPEWQRACQIIVSLHEEARCTDIAVIWPAAQRLPV